MPHRALIALGGNRGAVARAFQSALGLLGSTPGVSIGRVAPLFGTAPVGDQAGEPFVNSAAELLTSLEPLALLDRLQQVETALGRTRDVHWGPRTLDLDLIGVDDLVVRHPRLTLPHPHAWYRRFVLDPLAEIAPEWTHPVWRLDVAALRRRLRARPLPVVVAGGERSTRDSLAARLAPLFPQATLRTADVATFGTTDVASSQRTARSRGDAPFEEDPAPFWLWFGRHDERDDQNRAPRGPHVALYDFPESPDEAARHVLEAALGDPRRLKG